jgi:hypothetical protein
MGRTYKENRDKYRTKDSYPKKNKNHKKQHQQQPKESYPDNKKWDSRDSDEYQ